ncbi:MAG: tetratricopeptide repeat protein [Verrucomicrobia bacterium]|nr:tetratricopeptide repeat protein [Verrucomicrobiota bacterium]
MVRRIQNRPANTRYYALLLAFSYTMLAGAFPGTQAFGADPSAATGVRQNAEPQPPSPSVIRDALNKDKLTEAERLLDIATPQSPADPELSYLKSELYIRRSEFEKSRKILERLCADHPQRMDFQLRLAQVLSWTGRLKSAADAYRVILEKYPEDQDARRGYALTLFWRGNWSEAMSEIEESLHVEPDNMLGVITRLRILNASENTSQALEVALQKDAMLGRSNAELGLFIAQVYSSLGDHKTALEYASRQTDSTDLERRQIEFRANILIRNGDHEDGLDLVTQFANLHTNDYSAQVAAADAYAMANQPDTARVFYNRASAISPQRGEARLGMARLASREGRIYGSMNIYKGIAADNPQLIDAQLGLIRVAMLGGDTDTATRAISAIEKVTPHSAILYRQKIELALESGNTDAAFAHIDSYLQNQPNDRRAMLWKLFRQSFTGTDVSIGQLNAAADPLNPPHIALAALIAHKNSPATALEFVDNKLRSVPEKLRPHTRTAVARELAFLGLKDTALAQLPHTPERLRPEIKRDAWGWWAYLATPFAYFNELKNDFKSQSRIVWLCAALEKRLRTMQVEAESRLYNQWKFLRALWFSHHRNAPAAESSMRDLHIKIKNLCPAIPDDVNLTHISEAWRRSESASAQLNPQFQNLLTRARWRQYRFDYENSIQDLQRLQQLYPNAQEPPQRTAAILRASGRYREAADLLRRISHNTDSPLVRLEFADVLKRMNNLTVASQQYRELSEIGFSEPELYLGLSELAEKKGVESEAGRILVSGRRLFPEADSINNAYARLLVEQSELDTLTALINEQGPQSWLSPDILAPAADKLPDATIDSITASPEWWFSWNWLPWLRLRERSLSTINNKAETALNEGNLAAALHTIEFALDAGIPDSALWMTAARFFDYNQKPDQMRHAFRIAKLLGLGRIDAATGELTAIAAQGRPIEAARKFSEQLQTQPYDRSLRSGLVLALLQAEEISAAERALSPLVESAPDDVEVRMLAAQVKAAKGRVRQARSLYESILRNDPLSADPRAGRVALSDADQFGASVGYEHGFPKSNTGADMPDWRESFVSVFWHQPYHQTFSVEYRCYDRFGANAEQLSGTWTRGWIGNWITRLSAGKAVHGSFISDWRINGGATYKITDTLFSGVDIGYMDFHDITVLQWIPSVTLRLHPRWTTDARLYISRSELDSGVSDLGLTWLISTSLQFSKQSNMRVFYGFGDENSADLSRNLIGEGSFQSVGAAIKIGLRHKWTIEPGYRYEIHENFDLHSLSLNLHYSF